MTLKRSNIVRPKEENEAETETEREIGRGDETERTARIGTRGNETERRDAKNGSVTTKKKRRKCLSNRNPWMIIRSIKMTITTKRRQCMTRIWSRTKRKSKMAAPEPTPLMTIEKMKMKKHGLFFFLFIRPIKWWTWFKFPCQAVNSEF
uniref:Uncharacterized protein n=1 Tax=Cacopsylla melanoneura TaxID=428564 RepID=A0A8D9AXQ7_9HEMI